MISVFDPFDILFNIFLSIQTFRIELVTKPTLRAVTSGVYCFVNYNFWTDHKLVCFLFYLQNILRLLLSQFYKVCVSAGYFE